MRHPRDGERRYHGFSTADVRRHALFVLSVACALYLSGFSRAEARNCLDDVIQTVSDSGDILIMMSGSVYQVIPGDDIDSALWLPSEDVLICEAPLLVHGRYTMIYDIINTEEQGERVGAERIH